MREVVDLNSNGLSIESTGKILRGQSWSSRYFVCKKQSDISAPLFLVYKNASRRRSSHYKYTVNLESFIGIESCFELHRQSHTLAILTRETVLILAFSELKNAIVWESWIKNACGPSQCFFTQLLSAPVGSRAHSCKEVRVHLHNSHLSIIHGRPQEVLLSVDLSDIRIFTRTPLKFSFASSPSETHSNCYSFKCARLDIFYRTLDRAMHLNGLELFLNRTGGGEGEWIGEYIPQQKHEATQAKKKVASRTHSESFNAVYNAKKNGSSHHHVILNKDKSHSGHFYGAELPAVAKMCRTMSLASYKAFQEIPRFVVMNDGALSRESSFRSNSNVGDEYENSFTITEAAHHHPQPSSYQRNYINIDAARDGKMINNNNGSRLISRSKLSLSSDNSTSIDRGHGRRRSDNSVSSNSHGFLKRRINLSKQRSMMEFTDGGNEDLMDRYENWKKAKKFISSFRPRPVVSQSDLAKSSSTGALTLALGNNHQRSEQSLDAQWCALMDQMSSHDQSPPQLDASVSKNDDDPFHHLHLRAEKPPIAGLVRPSGEIHLHPHPRTVPRLSQRLNSTIQGSYAKYDGRDKSTHSYHEDEEEEVPVKDPIMHKFHEYKKKEIQKQTEEARKLTVDLDQVYCQNPNSPRNPPSVLLPLKKEKERKEKGDGRGGFFSLFTSPRNSTSLSESTRSSSDSLSSDTKSKVTQVSIKRAGSCSPPLTEAPGLPRQESTSTLVNRVSSNDSVRSDRTPTKAPTPPPLPKRTYTQRQQNSSGSSHGSPNRVPKTVDYCDLYHSTRATSACQLNDDFSYMVLDTEGTQAIKKAIQSGLNRELSKSSTLHPRKISQGEQSTTSDNMSIASSNPTGMTRQGFFRKYRKMRRDRKTATSMTNLNMT